MPILGPILKYFLVKYIFSLISNSEFASGRRWLNKKSRSKTKDYENISKSYEKLSKSIFTNINIRSQFFLKTINVNPNKQKSSDALKSFSKSNISFWCSSDTVRHKERKNCRLRTFYRIYKIIKNKFCSLSNTFTVL